MCRCLKISRSGYYKYKEVEIKEDERCQEVIQVFHENQKVYGTRKIQAVLKKKGILLSRRRIGRIMKKQGLISTYTVKKYRVVSRKCNEAKIENRVDRQFSERSKREVLVSDLTYVQVGQRWHYLCIIIDLYNREIVGHSSGLIKDAQLVQRAICRIKGSLYDVQCFHTDRGKEFDNQLINEVLDTFDIQRSLSRKGSPHDNAVAEAQFKCIKTEFVYPRQFQSLRQLELEFEAYVMWFNTKRVHSFLGYESPVEYRNRLSL